VGVSPLVWLCCLRLRVGCSFHEIRDFELREEVSEEFLVKGLVLFFAEALVVA
jgi:hypothetical protein